MAASAAHDFKERHRLVVDGMGFGAALRYRAPVPHARDGKVIADVVRMDKGHTGGPEPNVTRMLFEMVIGAAGGKHASRIATY